MTAILKLGVGAASAAIAASLVYVFWPEMAPATLSQRPAVAQPQFVARDPASAPAAPTIVAAKPAPASEAGSEMAKLASALKDPPVAATPTPVAPVVGEAVKRLCAEGMLALANGDVAGARALLEQAADGGDARALMALAATYDPRSLEQLGVVGAKGDAGQARAYYARALAAGVGAARMHLAAIDAVAPQAVAAKP